MLAARAWWKASGQEFSLTTPEGLALTGLAEALLRTPDASTQDRS